MLNKRVVIYALIALILFISFMGLNEIWSFDGYYRSIDEVMLHQKPVKKGATRVASIKNGSGNIEVVALEDKLFFYSFKSKNTITGEKYTVSQSLTVLIDYQSVQMGEVKWKVFCKNPFSPKKDEVDLYWHVSLREYVCEDYSSTCYDYDYNGKTYCLVTCFETRC